MGMAGDAATGLAERRRSSAMARRDPRPLLDLFPPPEDVGGAAGTDGASVRWPIGS